jgi:DNA-binding response OmpR family regulator
MSQDVLAGEKILIVEDEREIAEILKDCLESMGAECIWADNGAEGLIELQKDHKRFSLIISDVAMPIMTGTEFISSAMRLHGNLPIVMLTANSSFDVTRKSFSLGVIDYLLKPFRVTEFSEKVVAWIEIAKRRQNSTTTDGSKIEALLRVKNSLDS